MRCKTCHYSLSGLIERRCPECGREFDPADPTSFETPHKSRGIGPRLVVLLVLLPLVIWFLNQVQLNQLKTPLWGQARTPVQFGGKPFVHLRQVAAALLAVLWLACAVRAWWILRRRRTPSWS